MKDNETELLRKQLASALSGEQSHITFSKVVKNFPVEMRGKKPQGVPHSAWELVEHMRIAQRDILDFCRDPKHQSPNFPDGYWPKSEAPPNEGAWEATVKAFEEDEKELARLIAHGDLFSAFQHGDGQTLLRESLLVANHNSYELGQLVFLKRILLGKV